MSIIKLSQGEVEIIDELTWGQSEQVQTAIMAGAKLDPSGLSGIDAAAFLEAKYKLLEVAVVKVVTEGGEEKPFSRGWMDSLPVADGNKLFDAVDALTKKK